jgi:hypothetical protein
MLAEMLQEDRSADRIFKAQRENAQWAEIMVKQRKRLTQLRDQIFGLAGLREFANLYDRTQRRQMGIAFPPSSIGPLFKHKVTSRLRLTKTFPGRMQGRNIIPALFHLFQNAMAVSSPVKTPSRLL